MSNNAFDLPTYMAKAFALLTGKGYKVVVTANTENLVYAHATAPDGVEQHFRFQLWRGYGAPYLRDAAQYARRGSSNRYSARDFKKVAAKMEERIEAERNAKAAWEARKGREMVRQAHAQKAGLDDQTPVRVTKYDHERDRLHVHVDDGLVMIVTHEQARELNELLTRLAEQE